MQSKIKKTIKELEMTKRLVEAGKILGIEVIDHIIGTKTRFFSFQRKGVNLIYVYL